MKSTNCDSNLKFDFKIPKHKRVLLTFTKYNIIKFSNAIQKYVQEEKSIQKTKSKHKLRNVMITKAFYDMTELLKERKIQNFEYDEQNSFIWILLGSLLQ